MTKIIRINEQTLHNIIKETIDRVLLKESTEDNLVWDEIADSDGILRIKSTYFSEGGRDRADVNWEIALDDETGNGFYVTATITDSEIPRKFMPGFNIDFMIPKDVSEYMIEEILDNEVEHQMRGDMSRC